jgi:hypothetical protein
MKPNTHSKTRKRKVSSSRLVSVAPKRTRFSLNSQNSSSGSDENEEEKTTSSRNLDDDDDDDEHSIEKESVIDTSEDTTEIKSITSEHQSRELEKELIPLEKIEIRPMELDDLNAVYRLGESIFDKDRMSNLYRTWDPYCVTELFNTDSEFCLVAEADEEIVGFSMGTTMSKVSLLVY